MKVSIYRYNPETDDVPQMQDYEVELSEVQDRSRVFQRHAPREPRASHDHRAQARDRGRIGRYQGRQVRVTSCRCANVSCRPNRHRLEWHP